MRIGLGLLIAAAASTLVVALAGCGGGGVGSNLPDPTVLFINSSPDSNPLDFFINTDKKATALAFLDPAPVATTKKADHDISVQDSTDQSELDATAFSFADDTKYVSLALGLENYGAETLKRLRLVTFQYDKNAPNGTKARLLVIHGFMRQTGFDTPNIDFQNPGDNPQFSAQNIAFASSQPSTLTVDSGVSLIFQARRAGTENVYASDPGKTFDAGGIYLALVTGVENGVGNQAPQIKYIKLN
jgi:hypothetical protein